MKVDPELDAYAQQVMAKTGAPPNIVEESMQIIREAWNNGEVVAMGFCGQCGHPLVASNTDPTHPEYCKGCVALGLEIDEIG